MNDVVAGLHSSHLPHLDVRWVKRLVTLVLLGLAVHLLVPQIAGFSSTWQSVRALKWWLVAVAFTMQFGSYVGSGILLQGLVRLGGGRLKMMRGMTITVASGGIGLVAAGIVGSSAATYTWIRGAGDDGQGAGLAATLKPVFNNALLLVVAVFASIHLLLLGDLSTPEAIGFAAIAAILAAIIGGLVWGATHPTQLHRRLGSVRHRWARLRRNTSTEDIDERVQNDVNKLENAWILLRTGGWKQPLVGASINTIFDAASLYVLFIAAGDRISVAALLTGYSIALLLGKAAFLPGGVGVVEATMLAIYTSLGAQHPAVVVAVLGYRLLSLWIPALIGLPFAVLLQRTTSKLAPKPSVTPTVDASRPSTTPRLASVAFHRQDQTK